MLRPGFAVAALLIATTYASLDLSFGTDNDLTSYVTRPEIKTPKFEVNVYDEERVAPGYWFLAPYAMIFQEKHASKYYQPCQTGPSIYDSTGNLVWSGACKVKNQNTCDFRAWQFSNDRVYTSAILTPFKGVNDPQGHGIIMDNGYNTIGDIHVPTTEHNFNMHELNLIEDGRKALHIVHRPEQTNLSMYDENLSAGWILDVGFREIDLETGALMFEWWAFRDGHVSLDESRVPFSGGKMRKNPWNWFHGNSVEKNEDGDYLLSSRFTDTIFKISGHDGSVLWRLGGSKSSFTEDFMSARQHDARWRSRDPDNQREIITFLDNSADDSFEIRNSSIARTVELDFSGTTWTAKAIQTIERPDKRLTRMRGNHQVLKNGNSFVCWSENAVMSEHSPDGTLLMDARFVSRRFVTYRAYKFNFTSVPTEPIAVSAVAYGSTADSSTTVVHVSWNGATEVSSWRFKDSASEVIGQKHKTGFETTFQAPGYHSHVIVEAIAKNGSTIGQSAKTYVRQPEHWDAEQSAFSVDDFAPSTDKDEAGTVSAEEQTMESPRPLSRLSLLTSEGMAFALLAVTILMLCAALWLWRCTNGGRSGIRLSADRSYSLVMSDKGDDMS